jgi:hypothetical protein
MYRIHLGQCTDLWHVSMNKVMELCSINGETFLDHLGYVSIPNVCTAQSSVLLISCLTSFGTESNTDFT